MYVCTLLTVEFAFKKGLNCFELSTVSSSVHVKITADATRVRGYSLKLRKGQKQPFGTTRHEKGKLLSSTRKRQQRKRSAAEESDARPVPKIAKKKEMIHKMAGVRWTHSPEKRTIRTRVSAPFISKNQALRSAQLPDSKC